MCGRFTREYSWRQVHDFLDLKFPEGVLTETDPELDRSYNVAPTQPSLIGSIDEDSGGLELVARRWGLIPHWAKSASMGSRMINARSETASSKPAFRVAFSRRRCVVPVSSFYEWEKIEGEKRKLPWRILRVDDEILLFAGLWEPPNEHAPDGSFTILTTEANAFVAEIHDRMPVILEPEDVARWCDPSADKAAAEDLLRPASDGVLRRHPVSARVNSPRNNDAALVQRTG